MLFCRLGLPLATLTALVASIAAPAVAAPPFPLGVYAGNPNGTYADQEAAFETQFTSFVTTMQGARPTFMDGYVDYTQDPSQWPANAAWTAWSWAQSPVVGTLMIPVLGIPLSDNAHWQSGTPETSDDFFKQIVSGSYDADYKGVLDAWVQAGFHTFYLRLGWEMDLTTVPWFMGADPATQADWVAAFQYLANLMRAEAAVDGVSVAIVWNPDDVSWTALSVAAAYPGDAAVDVISVDSYSQVFPTTLYDWRLNDWTYDSSVQQWWQRAANRRHFWNYPSANGWAPEGNGSGWGMTDAIRLARQHHKALAVSECGAGGDDTTNGPADDASFPEWLARELRHARSFGLPIAYVNIWDVWAGSNADWDFSSPAAGKPLEAAAWAQFFGNPVTPPIPVTPSP